MKTAFLLMAQYDGQAIIPLDRIREDYFSTLTRAKFMRKLNEGKIPLPVMRMENSQQAQRGVHIDDLAAYLDQRREQALKDFQLLHA